MATNEEKRRKIGSDMIERRTGRAQVDDINALLNPPRERRTLKQLEPRGGVTGQVGTGNYTAPPATGGGIASPLVEPDAGNREYYPTVLLPTTDGLAWVRLRSVRRYVMEDANGDEVIQEFANGFT